MRLVKSSTTATLQHWPARLVPAPLGSSGAPNFRHAATAACACAYEPPRRHQAENRDRGCCRRANSRQKWAAEPTFCTERPHGTALLAMPARSICLTSYAREISSTSLPCHECRRTRIGDRGCCLCRVHRRGARVVEKLGHRNLGFRLDRRGAHQFFWRIPTAERRRIRRTSAHT